ncbi:MAG: response regulator [Rhodospirillales bacterium]
MTESDGKVILLVEDSETQAIQTTALLENEGFKVERKARAEDALEYLNTMLPDLIVVDYHLPGMDGDEFCRLVRFNPVIEPVPMLILTDDTLPDTERQGLDSGADDHITKSTDSDVLIARIHAVMRKPRSAALPGAAKHPQAQRILLIDDSPTYLAFLQQELEIEGYRIEAVSNGADALKTLNKMACDCIVVDLVMPGMDGIELCKHFDDFRRNSNLSFPVLMVTGQDSKDEMMRALDAGADDFVSKSNDIAVVKARIRVLLRRKMMRDEHDRITTQFRDMELQVLKERSEKEVAQKRIEWAEELEKVNDQLKRTNVELKDAQSQLTHAAKMASLGVLVAGIAHEVNNPLAYSMGHLNTIRKRLTKLQSGTAEALDPENQGLLSKALERVNDTEEGLTRVRDIIDQLRTFSRVDSGDFGVSDIQESTEMALRLLGHRLPDGVKVVTDFAPDNRLACDAGAINQVLVNLVSNAIDAVDENGQVFVSTGRDGDMYEIVVGDTGPGVPDDIKDRIFEPFFTTKPVGSGTGLGLSITYRIIENHEGTLEVRDRLGGGSEFVIRIPADLKHGRANGHDDQNRN